MSGANGRARRKAAGDDLPSPERIGRDLAKAEVHFALLHLQLTTLLTEYEELYDAGLRRSGGSQSAVGSNARGRSFDHPDPTVSIVVSGMHRTLRWGARRAARGVRKAVDEIETARDDIARAFLQAADPEWAEQVRLGEHPAPR